jgi:hypothetical protein
MRSVPLATFARGPARRDPGGPRRDRRRSLRRADDAAPAGREIEVLLRIPTNDPALRGGRAGWRTVIDIIRRLPSTPDPCATLQAWRRTGFAPEKAPIPLDVLVNPAARAAEGKLAVAARRMGRLGVSAGAARRFTGKGMFAGVGSTCSSGAGAHSARRPRRAPRARPARAARPRPGAPA